MHCAVFVSIPDLHTLDASRCPNSGNADTINQVWWCAPVTPKKQVDQEFKAILVQSVHICVRETWGDKGSPAQPVTGILQAVSGRPKRPCWELSFTATTALNTRITVVQGAL